MFTIGDENCGFIEMLNDEKKARLLDAICATVRGGEIPPLDEATNIVFRVLQRDSEKFSPITKSSQTLDVITEDQERNKEKVCTNVHTKEKKERMADSILADQTVFAAFTEFEKMRKMIKKPLTDLAKTRALSKLERLSGGAPDKAVAILNQSVDHCWQDLYEVKTEERRETQKMRNANVQRLYGFSTERMPGNPDYVDYNKLALEKIKRDYAEMGKEGEE